MIKNFLGLKNIIERMWLASQRFPLAVAAAVLATADALYLLHSNKLEHELGFAFNFLMVCILAFFWFASAVLLSEDKKWGTRGKFAINLAVVVILALYYFSFPENLFEFELFYPIRYATIAIPSVLSLLFVKFIWREEELKNRIRAFWIYNKKIFYSAALTALYAGVLQAGLSIALVSVDYLFELNIDEKRYAEIWFFILGIFSPLFFLSRVPKSFDELLESNIFPKELRLFAQYVLVPLVTIYFLILYAYVFRVLLTWEWPKGVLAFMITGFSFVGILTYVILYPLRAAIPWIRKAGTVFFIALVPQTGMLFWSLWFRVSQYGVTENRFLVFLFGCWLLGISIYILLSKVKDIRILPVSFAIIVLLSSFGPFGMFSVAKHSQLNRLENIFEKNQMLESGLVKKVEDENKISFDDRKEISGIIAYLEEVHGVESIQMFFEEDLETFRDKKFEGDEKNRFVYRDIARAITEDLVGVGYISRWEVRDIEDDHFSFYAHGEKTNNLTKISGFDYMIDIFSHNEAIAFDIEEEKYELVFSEDKRSFSIKRGEEILAESNIDEFVSKLLEEEPGFSRRDIDQEKMTISFENEFIKYEFRISSMSGERKDDGNKITYVNGVLVFSLK